MAILLTFNQKSVDRINESVKLATVLNHKSKVQTKYSTELDSLIEWEV